MNMRVDGNSAREGPEVPAAPAVPAGPAIPAAPAAPAGPAIPDGPGDAADGSEPDARFTFANERTFLAWSRTSLALVVAGLAVIQLLPPFPGVPWGRHLIGTPLILLGGAVAVISYREWRNNQRALRRGDPLHRSYLPRLLAATVAGIALLAAALALLSAASGHR